MSRLILCNATLTMAGISTLVASFSGSHILSHISYASFFGFFSGGYIGLTSIITVDLVGIATAIGTPVVGAICNVFESHNNPFLWSYFIFGVFVVLSGCILFAIPALIRRQKAQQNITKHQADINVLSH
ncbi:unnamed protein product [Adineta steineri]|uniref:Uncharacterized protein n=1 Tax=Adineta steineri TaxID=433720 RepID=A0A816BRI7_9BILA|nr:unnamed protein product [Adineta steineri]CAF1613238.1 unnamed protein product [Adineta steineri]